MWTFSSEFQLTVAWEKFYLILAMFPINLVPLAWNDISLYLSASIKMIILMNIRKYHLLQLILFFRHPHHLLWMFKHLHTCMTLVFLYLILNLCFFCWLPVYICVELKIFCRFFSIWAAFCYINFKYWHKYDVVQIVDFWNHWLIF
jgi:hypothetical protein